MMTATWCGIADGRRSIVDWSLMSHLPAARTARSKIENRQSEIDNPAYFTST